MAYRDTAEWQQYQELLQRRPELFKQHEMLKIVTDPGEIEAYTEQTGRKIGVVYRSNWNMMVVDLVRNRDNRLFAYERVIPAANGTPIVIIPVFNGEYLLLKQFRHAMRDFQYAFPRGYGEDGISSEENACKELAEETGAICQESEIMKIGTVIADSGVNGTLVDVYVANISQYELKSGYEGIADIEIVSRETLQEMIHTGKINDGFTLSALALLAGNKE